MMRMLATLGNLVGRVGLGAIFLVSGISKILDWEGTQKVMSKAGMTTIPFFLFAAILIEVMGGLAVIVGYRARLGALLLVLFLMPTTYIFHAFWELSGREAELQQIMFLKNISIAGGLLLILSNGPGSGSLERG